MRLQPLHPLVLTPHSSAQMSRDNRILIVVDEAQMIYDPEASGSEELWDCLKHGAVTESKVVFLFAASHGSNPSADAGVATATPYHFGPDQTVHLR